MILNLIDRMKLPFRKSKEFLTALYDILGFYPHNIEIYRIAFSHKSLTYTRMPDKKARRKTNGRPQSDYTPRPLNNERLEFLGDAVIETVVSDILFRHFDHKREGFLTSTRSKIVQREALNHLATNMGLDRLIQAAQGMSVYQTNIGGNAFEALMGAIYLDRGYKYCHWFIANRVIGRYIDIDKVAKKEVNFKSKLLEWSQKNRINISYRDVSHKGENKGFSSVLTIEGIIMGRGEGRSKKESQQEASREALTRMRSDAKTYDSLFRAKEKRTAMEAEESFALPKIDEIEASLNGTSSRTKTKKDETLPVLEKTQGHEHSTISDEAYDAAYNEDANYEVIDTPAAEPQLTAADYEAKGLPMPPEADELAEDDEKEEQRRTHTRKQHTAKNEALKDKKVRVQSDVLSQAEENDLTDKNEMPTASPHNERNKTKKKEAKTNNQAQSAETIEVKDEKTTSPSTTNDPRLIIVRNIEPVEALTDEKGSETIHQEVIAPISHANFTNKDFHKEAEENTQAETKASTNNLGNSRIAEEEASALAEATTEAVQVTTIEATPTTNVQEAEAPTQQVAEILEEAIVNSKECTPNNAEAMPEAPNAPLEVEDADFSTQLEVDEELKNIDSKGDHISSQETINQPTFEAGNQTEDSLVKDVAYATPDEDAFEPYEIDNLPDITGNDSASEASENEMEYSSAPHTPLAAKQSTTRPILRHLSLDDFVLGIEPDGEFFTNEAELDAESAPSKPKPRSRKRKPATKAEQIGTEDTHNTTLTDEQSTNSKKSRSHRRPSPKKRTLEVVSNEAQIIDTTEKAGEAETTDKPKRRYRRPAQPTE